MSGKVLPPFRTGPSHIGRYFFHDCERFLRYSTTRKDLAAKQGIPERPFDTSPIMQAVLERGYDWEQEAVAKLGKAVAVPVGKGKLSERKFSWEQTLDLLRKTPAGHYLYQATLHPSSGFYKHFDVDPAVVLFGDNHPDLIQIVEEDGRRLLRVIDVKRGSSMRASYRIQVLLYAWQLQFILQEHGITDASADLAQGGVWLGGEPTHQPCDLEPVRPLLESFLRQRMPAILAAPAHEADWHVHFRCEWCPYFDHCRGEMKTTDNVSRLVGITVQGKRYLEHEGGVKTLPELAKLLKRKDADEVLGRSASLAGKRRRLTDQLAAYTAQAPVVSPASTPVLPIHENIALFLTLQQEPLAQGIYLAGLLVHAGDKVRPKLSDRFAGEPRVWLAATADPEALAGVRRNLIVWLHELLAEVDAYNRQRPHWEEQLSVQTYVHSEHERKLLVRCLLEAMAEPDLAERAMQLLFYFQGPDLLLADDHPEEATHYPLVVLLGVQSKLVALPVDVSYTLPEALAALGSKFEYRRMDFYHFPLGPGLRPDAIYLAWTRDRGDYLAKLQTLASNHLRAVRALLWSLREHAKDSLYAWPPKFVLPATAGIRDPLLSRMAFFARYESILGCMGLREARAEAREVQSLLGGVVELQAESSSRFKVLGDTPDAPEEGFPRYLLVRDTPAGRRAQLEFQDYYYRAKPYGKQHADRAVVGIGTVYEDKLGFPRTLEIHAKFEGGVVAARGEKFLLYPRFTDFNSDKVVKHLKQIDEQGDGLFVDLIHDPDATSAALPLPAAIERTAKAEEGQLHLTPSQVDAYRAVRRRRVVAVWGPPGTGKTHYLASMILGLASAHAQADKPFRVLVSAFTHASIENVLRKIAQLQASSSRAANDLQIGKSGGWRSPGPNCGDEVDPAALGSWLTDYPTAVVGSTVWACLKLEDPDRRFDLVILDEASQVRVPESSIAISLVAPKGRLVLAGDHLQLPPIVAGVYPEPAEGQQVLHRSIFELVQSRCKPDQEDGPCRQLLENFRMNDVLTSYAAGLLYGPRYQCASDEVAARRLKLKPLAHASELVAACLDPKHPLVIVVIEGAPAVRENQIEAQLVADLVGMLRDHQHDRKGKSPYGKDADFFRDGLFVVSPHHAQIGLIRRALAAQRDWTSPPFVDTVDKMQGQETDSVIVSYGVSDAEFAMQEAEFIYGLNRLNVAITRARSKCIVCLPAPLLESSPEVLDIEEAEQGLAYMQRLVTAVTAAGETMAFDLGGGLRAKVLRTDGHFPRYGAAKLG